MSEPKGTTMRSLAESDAQKLRPGSDHYTAYVGPPGQFDFMGATQFRLLCAIGMRSHHTVLDFGCGSLRAGRLLMPYLDPGNYHGLEPNSWLVQEAIDRQIGADMIRIKRPVILHHDTFSCREFGALFDYIIAQSILSHAGMDLVRKILGQFRDCLAPEGIAAVTFVETPDGEEGFTGSGWVYPGVVSHPPGAIAEVVTASGLIGLRVPWYHPRQTWYLLAQHRDRLPTSVEISLLRGAVLFDEELVGSTER